MRLGAAHQRGEPGPAERGIGVAVRGRALHVRDQPGVRGPRGRQRGLAVIGRGSRGARPPARGCRRAAPRRPARSPGRGPMAASTTRGQAARCSARAASRSSGGRSPGRSRPGRARRGAASGCGGAARARRRRPGRSSNAARCASSCGPRAARRGPRRRQPGQPGADAGRGQVLGLPSYSCRPPYSRTSATSRSQTARNRGERSMRQTLPEVPAPRLLHSPRRQPARGHPAALQAAPTAAHKPPRRGLMRGSGHGRHSRIHDQARTGGHVRHGGLDALARLGGRAGGARARR